MPDQNRHHKTIRETFVGFQEYLYEQYRPKELKTFVFLCMTQAELTEILNELRTLPAETEVAEFKEAKTNYDFNKLGKYFSALSNEANLKNKHFAWLILGIKDSTRDIVGSSFRSETANLHKLKSEIAQHTINRITFIEIYELQLHEGRIVMFQIPAAPKGIPVSWKGHYYGRDNEELVPLNLEEVERIRKQVTSIDWSAGICIDASLSDLDPVAILKARENFKKKNQHLSTECDNWDEITFLNKAKITIRGQITRTAILLLGKPESEHFIHPAIARITWILKDKDNIEKDYTHFSCPFILATDEVFQKIRNLKYRYIKEGTLFPEEVDQYHPYIIREALNNCIAHQDYLLAGKINVVEIEDGRLIFTNSGSFIPGSIDKVISQDAPQEQYRNPFLAEAMVNLNMIDTIGSGIKRMFSFQRDRLFPLPEYEIGNNRVKVEIIGKVLDLNYARLLAQNKSLSLQEIILLDKVQKNKPLAPREIKQLKGQRLIEGRKPNFYISSSVAQITGTQDEYLRQRGIDDDYCRKIILDYLRKFAGGSRADFEKVLLDKLPDVLTEKQKKDKIKNNLQALRIDGDIEIDKGRIWRLSKNH
ncbi:RNA-binding domain-containing protein [Draconibacterium sediminis]|uniref:RNA-binding domain-containing protein n=1 Tax=Draconibacterium sediminis TaxID=1544798 RepID=UPI0026EAB843|nr:RNA-binding domain-containing protein [Draconibacterium sediminis]